MKIFSTLLLSLIVSQSANAGLESCGQNQQQNTNLEVTCASPFVFGTNQSKIPCSADPTQPSLYQFKNNLSQPEKSPFLVYYAVDTLEPFMQASVDFEVKKLREVCSKNKLVNWIVFLNSHYVNAENETPSFLFCKNGKVESRDYPSELIESLNTKRYIIENAATIDIYEQLAYMMHLIRYPRYTELEDGTYVDIGYQFAKRNPFAHPDYLFDLISYVRQDIFPYSDYVPFLHLKSHGSKEFLLTGLTSYQEEDKTKCQDEIISRVDELKNYKPIVPGQAGLGDINLFDFNSYGQSLGNRARLSLENGGLGNRGQLGASTGLGGIAGLGGNAGLSSLNHFGMNHLKAPQLITNLTLNAEVENEIAFIMFESCETNIQKKVLLNDYTKTLANLRSYYTAQGSLWYRNLNWHELLLGAAKAKLNNQSISQSGLWQELVLKQTLSIPNYIEKTNE